MCVEITCDKRFVWPEKLQTENSVYGDPQAHIP
ncbi:Uncharacterised protein [Klebsiella variicola]|nr:Uncharacterised protein [Klebsiella variicola]